MRKGKYVYIKVSNDIYELPIAIADSAEELAKQFDVPVGSIYSSVARCKKPKINKDGNSYYYPYRKVKIE